MKLPKVNSLGYFEIRLESIGGLGANSAGKMLADVGILSQDYNGATFSSYGSEKKGSPVKSFVRFCDSKQPVWVNSIVEEPHVVAVFHMNLLSNPMTLMGVKEDATVIFNTGMNPDEARDFAKLHGGKVVCIDAIRIANELKLPQQGSNTIIAGAMVKQLPFIDKKKFEEKIRSQFKSKPHVIEANITAFNRGYDECVVKDFKADKKYPYVPFKKPEPVYGKNNQVVGGIITACGNSTQKDLSVTRTGRIPVYHSSNCIHCANCELVCPDMCIVFERNKEDGKMYMKGVDYKHCKGCLKCVMACPTTKKEDKAAHALTKETEANYKVADITYSRYNKK